MNDPTTASSYVQTDPDLRAALEQFETALESPVVPGELVAWTRDASTGLEALRQQERRQLVALHPQQFAEIASQDPGLSQRVVQLQHEDAGIAQALVQHATRWEQFVPAVEAAEPDEAAVEEERAQLVQEGLALVIRIRTQEAAARTWLIEAFQRDRGEVD